MSFVGPFTDSEHSFHAGLSGHTKTERIYHRLPNRHLRQWSPLARHTFPLRYPSRPLRVVFLPCLHFCPFRTSTFSWWIHGPLKISDLWSVVITHHANKNFFFPEERWKSVTIQSSTTLKKRETLRIFCPRIGHKRSKPRSCPNIDWYLRWGLMTK